MSSSAEGTGNRGVFNNFLRPWLARSFVSILISGGRLFHSPPHSNHFARASEKFLFRNRGRTIKELIKYCYMSILLHIIQSLSIIIEALKLSTWFLSVYMDSYQDLCRDIRLLSAFHKSQMFPGYDSRENASS